MTFEEWKSEIEARRFQDYRQCLREQAAVQAEYDSYVSRYKSYSYEEMRDYGHTWGPGFEPERPEPALPEYYKVEGLQAEILEQMLEKDMADEDIRYIFLSKCAWDDEYPICQIGEEYDLETIASLLLERHGCTEIPIDQQISPHHKIR